MNKLTREEILANIPQADVYRKLAELQLSIPKKPQDIAEGIDLATEWDNVKRKCGGLANIPYHELGDFLDRWTALVSFARWEEAKADMNRQTGEEMKNHIKKQLYMLQEGTREIRDAAVHVEPMYMQLQNQYIEANALYIAVRALREGYEQRANSISREITRRCSDNQDVKRGINRGQTS